MGDLTSLESQRLRARGMRGGELERALGCSSMSRMWDTCTLHRSMEIWKREEVARSVSTWGCFVDQRRRS